MFRHIYREWLECPRHRPEYPFFLRRDLFVSDDFSLFASDDVHKQAHNKHTPDVEFGRKHQKYGVLIPTIRSMCLKLSENDQNFTSSAMISSHGEHTQSRETHLWPFFRQQTRRNDYLRIFALNTTAQLST